MDLGKVKALDEVVDLDVNSGVDHIPDVGNIVRSFSPLGENDLSLCESM